MNHENEKYYVAGFGETPEQIFFDRESAEASRMLYLDAFGADGKRLQSYKLVGEGTGARYTTDF